MCVCVPLNYLTSERNGAIEIQHNNNSFLTMQYNNFCYLKIQCSINLQFSVDQYVLQKFNRRRSVSDGDDDVPQE